MTQKKKSFGLWKNKSKNWLNYLGWSIEVDWVEYWVNIFKNTSKSKDTHPDYNLTLNPKNPKLVDDDEDTMEEVPF